MRARETQHPTPGGAGRGGVGACVCGGEAGMDHTCGATGAHGLPSSRHAAAPTEHAACNAVNSGDEQRVPPRPGYGEGAGGGGHHRMMGPPVWVFVCVFSFHPCVRGHARFMMVVCVRVL